MADNRVLTAKQRIDRYERILEGIHETSARLAIEQLLDEAWEELAAAESGEIVSERSRRWRLKAEEYRTTADVTRDQTAQQTYRRLAENYERLADESDDDKVAHGEKSEPRRNASRARGRF